MPRPPHPLFRSVPDLKVNSATRVPTAPELNKFDRKLGWIAINRWTYRIFRRLGALNSSELKDAGVCVTEESSAGRGAIFVRPDEITGSGAVFLIHGGGFVIGSNRDVFDNAVSLARQLGVPVICPSYRLAPQDPFPAALDDCRAAWLWLIENAAGMDVDATKIVVGGYSAGGGLAATLVQRLHDEGGVQPAAQLLVYPMLDDHTASRRDLDKPRHRVWGNRHNLFGWTSYLGHPPDQPVPFYAVSARRDDLSGLPPAWIGVGTSDLFLDENRTYAQRLTKAGVDVTYVEVEGAIHGFDLSDTTMKTEFSTSQVAFMQNFTN